MRAKVSVKLGVWWKCLPIAYISKSINVWKPSIPPGQWIRSGCLVVNLTLFMLPSNIVVECYYEGAIQQKDAILDAAILDVAILDLTDGNLTESIASIEPSNLKHHLSGLSSN